MTKEVLYAMTKKLKFQLEFYDNEEKEQNKYLCITLPIIKKDKITEDDEFKDEDINEMIGKNYSLLDEKLKRQLPNSLCVGERKNSNSSTIHIVDMLSKNGDEKKEKETSESLLSFPKNTNYKNDNYMNSNINISNNNGNNNISNNLNLNDNQKKYLYFYSTPSNDSFLSKCLKFSENKKNEKEKYKFNKDNSLNFKVIRNKINNHSSGKNIFINITNINNSPKKKKFVKTKSFVSLKRIINKNNHNLKENYKSNKLKGIFTVINKYGYPEDMDLSNNISNISNDTQKNRKNQNIALKGSPNTSLKENPKNLIFDNKNNNKISNLFKLNPRKSEAQNSVSVKTGFFGPGDRTKSSVRSSVFISEIAGENDEKNKNSSNINKNKIINNLAKLEKVGVKIEYAIDEKKNK